MLRLLSVVLYVTISLSNVFRFELQMKMLLSRATTKAHAIIFSFSKVSIQQMMLSGFMILTLSHHSFVGAAPWNSFFFLCVC